ncbi:MAG TPA: SPFH domain-containing protein [Armatimonadota bacterium]|nr:SPFH domain-containing protein [Armatimonadota bacterium]
MSREVEVKAISGWPMLFIFLILLAVVVTLFVNAGRNESVGPVINAAVLLVITMIIFPGGFVVIEPNGSSVLLLAGKYRGTIKESGFKWVIPFYSKRPVSLRVKTLNGEKLKVNDLAGNPVEIAAIVVWRVRDTYSASFEVDNYAQYVAMQSETAVRHLASLYPYDAGEDSLSLRRNAEEVSAALQKELQERLDRAGVEVMEARLSHLAYAQEIASAMLRKQQAAAIIAARQIIVEGAVGMVEMALDRLEQYKKLSLDEERKAAMVSNLLVVLCSDHAAQPVLNTGTLY